MLLVAHTHKHTHTQLCVLVRPVLHADILPVSEAVFSVRLSGGKYFKNRLARSTPGAGILPTACSWSIDYSSIRLIRVNNLSFFLDPFFFILYQFVFSISPRRVVSDLLALSVYDLWLHTSEIGYFRSCCRKKKKKKLRPFCLSEMVAIHLVI